MAFKIAGKVPTPASPEEAAAPEEATEPEEMAESPEEQAAEGPEGEAAEGDEAPEEGSGGRVLLDPQIVNYKTPDQGPFMCGNCTYFSLEKPNTCHFVSGHIDPMSHCNLFNSAGAAQGGEEDESMEGDQPPMEESMEAPEEPPQE